MLRLEHISFEERFQDIMSSLELLMYEEAADKLSSYYPGEKARLLEAIPPKERVELWRNIHHTAQGDILKELASDVQSQLIQTMDTDTIISATENLDVDDLADIIPSLPETTVHNLLLTLDNKYKKRLKQVLSYPQDSAGGLMNTDIITVRPNITIATVIRYFRILKQIPVDTDKIFIVNRGYKYLGSVHILTLLAQEDDSQVLQFINYTNVSPIVADTPAHEVAKLFEQRDLISAPVIDKNNQLIGRITIDDVVDVIRKDAEHSVMSMAGLGENDDIFAPVVQSTKRRSIWLGINLITAFITIFFIGLFEATLQEKITLAILMPVIASMGGIAGTQTIILVTRNIALGRITSTNIKTLINKEIIIGFLNGIIWALIIAFITYIWFDDLLLSVIAALAITANLIFAAIAGAFLPSTLIKLKIDPALAGGVILTTITDIVGFVAFLGLASLFI